MKLVTQYVDPSDAARASLKLREAGVMTKVTFVDPHNIKPSKSGAVRVGLWVVYDDQFEDAVQLLKNPEHIPKRVISLAEMSKLEPSIQENRLLSRKKLLGLATIIIVGACLFALIIYIVMGYFSDT